MVLRCCEHEGLWVRTEECAAMEELMEGMPHAIVLQDVAGDLFILASAAAAPSNHTPGTSGSEVFSCAVMLDRGDADWLEKLGQVRHYLYPVHISKRFVIVPSLAAAMSLLIFKLIHRQYADAVRLAPACVSDTTLRCGHPHSMWLSNRNNTIFLSHLAHQLVDLV